MRLDHVMRLDHAMRLVHVMHAPYPCVAHALALAHPLLHPLLCIRIVYSHCVFALCVRIVCCRCGGMGQGAGESLDYGREPNGAAVRRFIVDSL
jgi:hypothetical protein